MIVQNSQLTKDPNGWFSTGFITAQHSRTLPIGCKAHTVHGPVVYYLVVSDIDL